MKYEPVKVPINRVLSYTTTYACKQRIVALLLMELLSKMRKMQTISSHVSVCAN